MFGWDSTPTGVGQAVKTTLIQSLRKLVPVLSLLMLAFAPSVALAGGGKGEDFTGSGYGIAAVVLFVVAYLFVMFEEQLHMRKSKPVMLAAGIIWVLVALAYKSVDPNAAHHAVLHNVMEYGELFLFLLAAMTYISTMEERGVFDALRNWLIGRGFSLRAVFWVTGLLAFFMSPIADNLTTALVMGAVVMAVGVGQPRFIAMSAINIVIAANAGGAFSPFGDITTLMVWQKGILGFFTFFALFLPAVANWLVPAIIMNFFLDKGRPSGEVEEVELKPGAIIIVVMFLCTIATAVLFHSLLHLPPAIGMMTGLGALKLFAWSLRMRAHKIDVGFEHPIDHETGVDPSDPPAGHGGGHGGHGPAPLHSPAARRMAVDSFEQVQRAEWDTLLFFYGIILAVGGLGKLGYLALLSQVAYHDLGATYANIGVGFLSAIVDNIPVMFAVLAMNPDMTQGQWLLVTLTAGVGGSMLSVGSAAGVALMGQARGIYTFGNHLKWAWAIALGYAASIGVHFLVNGSYFDLAIKAAGK